MVNDENYSLGSRVFRILRENILAGKYERNEELKEKTIGEELGVSRTPVREALRQLELEGLVTIIPNKGAYVVGISNDDIRDIYEIRSRLEGLCAKWAAEKITEEQLGRLEENVYLSEFHAEKGNSSQILALDNEFHEIIYEASNSKVIEKTLSDFHHYVQRVRKVTLSEKRRAKESNEEHRQILEALKHHDAAKADELSHKHMMNTIENLDKQGIDAIIAQGGNLNGKN